MKTFTLSSTFTVMRDGQTQICLKPSDQQIDEYLATYATYASEADALNDLDRFIDEQTPILYHIFQYTETIPQEIRDQYQLIMN
jgi:hypothetical protein